MTPARWARMKPSRRARWLRRKGLERKTPNPELVGKTGVFMVTAGLRERIAEAVKAAGARLKARAAERRERKTARRLVQAMRSQIGRSR